MHYAIGISLAAAKSESQGESNHITNDQQAHQETLLNQIPTCLSLNKSMKS